MPHGLSVYRLLELIPARQAWCLRAWIAAEGLRPLSKARLDDLLRQVRETHSDATFSFHVQRKEIRRWGSDIIVRDAVTGAWGSSATLRLVRAKARMRSRFRSGAASLKWCLAWEMRTVLLAHG